MLQIAAARNGSSTVLGRAGPQSHPSRVFLCLAMYQKQIAHVSWESSYTYLLHPSLLKEATYICLMNLLLSFCSLRFGV